MFPYDFWEMFIRVSFKKFFWLERSSHAVLVHLQIIEVFFKKFVNDFCEFCFFDQFEDELKSHKNSEIFESDMEDCSVLH